MRGEGRGGWEGDARRGEARRGEAWRGVWGGEACGELSCETVSGLRAESEGMKTFHHEEELGERFGSLGGLKAGGASAGDEQRGRVRW